MFKLCCVGTCRDTAAYLAEDSFKGLPEVDHGVLPAELGLFVAKPKHRAYSQTFFCRWVGVMSLEPKCA